MKKIIILMVFLCFAIQSWSQFQVSTPRTWDKYPPEVQKRGFGLFKSEKAQMDNSPALEDVLLFCSDNGHYPYFDLFKSYYVILDGYTKEVKFVSEVTISTERELKLEDRNNDGKFEIYRKYIKDGQFTVDENGNNLKATWVYDSIEWPSDQKQITTSKSENKP